MGNHLYDAIEAAVASPEQCFIETEAGRVITYGVMVAESAKIANLLCALGVAPGDRVACQVEKSADALLLYIACLRAGAVYLPLNTAYTANELSYFLEDARPALFVVSPEKRDGLTSITERIGALIETMGSNGDGTLLDRAKSFSATFSNRARRSNDLAAILYTSGTTGRSKGAMLTHENLLSNARSLKSYWHYSSNDRLIHALPIFHTHGLFVATNVTMLSGASMYLINRFDIEKIESAMATSSVLMGVPTFYTRLCDDPSLSRHSCRNMRLFISGSAPLLAETHRAFQEKAGHAILERYGMTETNMITSNPYEGARVAGTVGYALPDVTIRLSELETGRLLPAGEPGVIEVKGPNVFVGYWNMPEKTAEEFRADGFFITGDIGVMEDDGRLSIIGRSKDLIISGGFNIYPKEIENEIDAVEGVVESAVVGIAHPDLGEAVVACVVKHKDSALDEVSLLRALDGCLARFKLPKRIEFIDELPRNSMSKVQKNLLRTQYSNIFTK